MYSVGRWRCCEWEKGERERALVNEKVEEKGGTLVCITEWREDSGIESTRE